MLILPHAKHIFDDAESALQMVMAGAGITWASDWLAGDDLRCGRVTEVLKDWRRLTPSEALYFAQNRAAYAVHSISYI